MFQSVVSVWVKARAPRVVRPCLRREVSTRLTWSSWKYLPLDPEHLDFMTLSGTLKTGNLPGPVFFRVLE